MEKYTTEAILVNVTAINAMPIAAGVYKKGQILSWDDGGEEFTAYTTSSPDGIITCDLDNTDGTLYASVAKGEFSRKGVTDVMASLAAPVTVDYPLIAECFKNGIVLN
jgi:hypothetical protein